MSTRYFRAGVGTVIYNEHGQVAIFKRAMHPVGVWQFQQGGIDHGESPADTLWRELMEEVGLKCDDVQLTGEFPNWVSYEDLLPSTDTSIPRIGQIHRWFFLLLKPDAEINLKNATDLEFDAHRWVSFDDAIAETSDHKKHVYETLQSFFLEHIKDKDSTFT